MDYIDLMEKVFGAYTTEGIRKYTQTETADTRLFRCRAKTKYLLKLYFNFI